MHCTACGTKNPEGAKFCIECGGSFQHCCPSCGVGNPPQAKFCAECGTTLQPLAPSLRTLGSRCDARSAERRQLTVMFCDLVDSTALAEQLDPEEWRAVVREYQRVSAIVIRHFEGYIAQYLGDGLLVYFGYPVAHEDDALRAARAGLD